ncbi:MAG: peptidyl-prolyl cis-trans isomerase [Myxococcales bacterium]|nr:MAG: peptidyl-prolyl cis-trans isomerase [Myxococcales bacterium]
MLNTPENFNENIEEHGGAELGWISDGDLRGKLDETVKSLEPGEISPPARGAGGFHIFILHEKEKEKAATYEEMREQLYRRIMEETMARQEQLLLEQLRREAVISNRLL